jgi:hypothetical protein
MKAKTGLKAGTASTPSQIAPLEGCNGGWPLDGATGVAGDSAGTLN